MDLDYVICIATALSGTVYAQEETTASYMEEGIISYEEQELKEADEKQEDSFEIDEVHFPDAIFREYVAGESDHNGVLSAEEWNPVQEINVSGKGIFNLTGIEYFANLRMLYCQDNKLSFRRLTARRLRQISMQSIQKLFVKNLRLIQSHRQQRFSLSRQRRTPRMPNYLQNE